MTVRVKLGGGESYLEHQQVKARLEALGLKLNPDFTIDEASASNIAGGLEKLKALAKDGLIDADAVAQLRRQTHFLGRAVGKDLPISEKESNQWRTLALEFDGAAATIEAVNSEVRRHSTIDNGQFHRVGERLEQLQNQINKLSALEPDPARLAKVSPEVVRSIADGGTRLSAAVTAYIQTLSLFRSAMLEKLDETNGPDKLIPMAGGGYEIQKRPGWWTRAQTNALAGSLVSALNGLPTIAKLGDVLAMPMGSPNRYLAPTTQSASKAPLSQVDMVHYRIINDLGQDPSLFPGSVGPKSEWIVPDWARETFQEVLTAAARDMIGKGIVSNAYGNSNVVSNPSSLEETKQAVPRPMFRAALETTRSKLDDVLSTLPPGPTSAEVEAKAKKVLGDDAHYAAAVAAMYRASLKS
jgi:hypothetical protein